MINSIPFPSRKIFVLFLSALIILIGIKCSRINKSEYLVVGGTILTMNPNKPEAEAMIVRDGKIEAVGSMAELEEKYPDANVYNIEGRTILPGFIDSHTHVYELGYQHRKADLIGVKTVKEMVERLKKFYHKKPQGKWLIGYGWDEGEWASRGYPDRAELDRAFPENPVCLESLHGFAGFYNARALEIAGINANTPDPEAGKILRRKNGEPTGVLLTEAQELVNKHIPPEPLEEMKKSILLGLNTMAKEGVTSIHEAGTDSKMVKAFRELAKEKKLPIRVYGMLIWSDSTLIDEWFSRGPLIDPDAFFTIRTIKVFYDGSLGSRTALLRKPYSDEPENAHMIEYITPEELTYLSKRSVENGFQIAVHAIGDEANERVLSTFESVLKPYPFLDHRWRIEHAQVVLPDYFKRASKLGIISSMQPSHALEDKEWAENRVGPERIKYAYAWRSVLNAGGILLMNSDLPAVPWKPVYTLYFAVTRKDLNGNPPEGWYPEQAITVDEALYAMTVAGAYASFQENKLGSLSPGKFADFVELDKNPKKVKPEKLKNIKAIKT
ncbi:amidohydrolase [candidate division KSB1 bacterium]|nr:MAG: amidohydrolase [candidate division KSB1 bacterium]